MVQAYILIQTDVGKSRAVAAAVAQLEGVTSCEDVTGPYDAIARIEAEDLDTLGSLVIAKIQQTAGVSRTLTCPVVHV